MSYLSICPPSHLFRNRDFTAKKRFNPKKDANPKTVLIIKFGIKIRKESNADDFKGDHGYVFGTAESMYTTSTCASNYIAAPINSWVSL